MNELPVTLTELIDWLNTQPDEKIVGITHTSSHCFICELLRSKFKIKAFYVGRCSTKVCKLSKWNEYSNPQWLVDLIDLTNNTYSYDSVTKYAVPGLGKELKKADVLACINKLTSKRDIAA